jgi:hypothetical protein
MNKEIELSDLAQGILDGYWILYTPANAISFAIGEFLERSDDNPFTYNDEVVTAEQMLSATDELINYFEDANSWRAHDYPDDAVEINRAGELIARSPRKTPSRFTRFFYYMRGWL